MNACSSACGHEFSCDTLRTERIRLDAIKVRFQDKVRTIFTSEIGERIYDYGEGGNVSDEPSITLINLRDCYSKLKNIFGIVEHRFTFASYLDEQNNNLPILCHEHFRACFLHYLAENDTDMDRRLMTEIANSDDRPTFLRRKCHDSCTPPAVCHLKIPTITLHTLPQKEIRVYHNEEVIDVGMKDLVVPLWPREAFANESLAHHYELPLYPELIKVVKRSFNLGTQEDIHFTYKDAFGDTEMIKDTTDLQRAFVEMCMMYKMGELLELFLVKSTALHDSCGNEGTDVGSTIHYCNSMVDSEREKRVDSFETFLQIASTLKDQLQKQYCEVKRRDGLCPESLNVKSSEFACIEYLYANRNIEKGEVLWQGPACVIPRTMTMEKVNFEANVASLQEGSGGNYLDREDDKETKSLDSESSASEISVDESMYEEFEETLPPLCAWCGRIINIEPFDVDNTGEEGGATCHLCGLQYCSNVCYRKALPSHGVTCSVQSREYLNESDEKGFVYLKLICLGLDEEDITIDYLESNGEITDAICPPISSPAVRPWESPGSLKLNDAQLAGADTTNTEAWRLADRTRIGEVMLMCLELLARSSQEDIEEAGPYTNIINKILVDDKLFKVSTESNPASQKEISWCDVEEIRLEMANKCCTTINEAESLRWLRDYFWTLISKAIVLQCQSFDLSLILDEIPAGINGWMRDVRNCEASFVIFRDIVLQSIAQGKKDELFLKCFTAFCDIIDKEYTINVEDILDRCQSKERRVHIKDKSKLMLLTLSPFWFPRLSPLSACNPNIEVCFSFVDGIMQIIATRNIEANMRITVAHHPITHHDLEGAQCTCAMYDRAVEAMKKDQFCDALKLFHEYAKDGVSENARMIEAFDRYHQTIRPCKSSTYLTFQNENVPIPGPQESIASYLLQYGIAALNMGDFNGARIQWAKSTHEDAIKQCMRDEIYDQNLKYLCQCQKHGSDRSKPPCRIACKQIGRQFIFTTTTPLLTQRECQKIIQAAESRKWTTSRHKSVPTIDIPVHEVPEALEAINALLERGLADLLVSKFPNVFPSERSIKFHDAFIVKYDTSSEGRCSLPMHSDQSEVSLTISLNSDFSGGGTSFEILSMGGQFDGINPVLCPAGSVTIFDGNLIHGGAPILSGTRYIITAFLYGYSPLRHISEDVLHLLVQHGHLGGVDLVKLATASFDLREIIVSRHNKFERGGLWHHVCHQAWPGVPLLRYFKTDLNMPTPKFGCTRADWFHMFKGRKLLGPLNARTVDDVRRFVVFSMSLIFVRESPELNAGSIITGNLLDNEFDERSRYLMDFFGGFDKFIGKDIQDSQDSQNFGSLGVDEAIYRTNFREDILYSSYRHAGILHMACLSFYRIGLAVHQSSYTYVALLHGNIFKISQMARYFLSALDVDSCLMVCKTERRRRDLNEAFEYLQEQSVRHLLFFLEKTKIRAADYDFWGTGFTQWENVTKIRSGLEFMIEFASLIDTDIEFQEEGDRKGALHPPQAAMESKRQTFISKTLAESVCQLLAELDRQLESVISEVPSIVHESPPPVGIPLSHWWYFGDGKSLNLNFHTC